MRTTMKRTGGALACLLLAGSSALSLAPAASADVVDEGTIRLDETCPTDKYDTTAKDRCTWIEVTTPDLLYPGVGDAVHAGVHVSVVKDGTEIGSGNQHVKYTGDNGRLTFVGATAGDYAVTMTAPQGFKLAGSQQAGTTPGTSATIEFTIAPVGGVVTSRLFTQPIVPVNTPVVPVEMYVFEDTNLNGLRDAGENTPPEPISLKFRNPGKSTTWGVPALNNFGAGNDTGSPRTYWFVAGDYDVELEQFGGTREMIPVGAGIEPVEDQYPVSGRGSISIPAQGTSLIVPVAPKGSMVTPTPEPEPEPGPQPEPEQELAAPEVSLVSAPYSVTTETTATFEFAADQDVTWSYELDAAPLEQTGAVLTLTDLTVGDHTLAVTATSTTGELLTSTYTYDWTITDDDGLPRAAVSPGETFEFIGFDFTAGEDLQVWLQSDPAQLVTTGTADDTGAGHIEVTVPDLADGSYLLEMRGLASGETRWLWLDVTTTPEVEVPGQPGDGTAVPGEPAPGDHGPVEQIGAPEPSRSGYTQTGTSPDGLAVTGVSPWQAAGAACALVACGGGFLIARRRAAAAATDVAADTTAA